MKETALLEFYTNNSIVAEELTLSLKCSIDIAIVNGSLQGYGIISAQHILARLQTKFRIISNY